MMMRWAQKVAGLMLVTGLASCGGGGGDAGATKYPSDSEPSSSSSSGNGTTTVVTNSSGSVVLSLSSTQVSSSSPGTVTALVRDASNNPISGALVTFSVSQQIAGVSPASVVTDSVGEASTALLPTTASSSGGAFVNATVELPNGSASLTSRVTFSVSALNVTLSAASAANANLGAYASTTISFTVTGASPSNPVKVLLSSTCVSANKATISPSSLTLTATSGAVTYKDNGCAAQDRVNVSIEGTSQSRPIDMTIAAPTSTAIEFVRATPTTIGLQGSGSPTTSLVTFKVTDQAGLGVPSETVNFTLDQSNIASLTASSGITGNDGTVVVGVNSISTPSPVRVRATLASDSDIYVPSSELTINAGLPHQEGFSIAFEKTSMNGNLDGDESEVRITLTDRYGNPVPDGTRVNLVSEGGVVIPASCTTSDAVCKVKFVVSNPRPMDGRVALTAYAVGEETYVDANANLIYNTGENFTDLGQVYLDKDEDGVVDSSGEFITGGVVNGVWDRNTYVRGTATLIFSRTDVRPRFFKYNGSACTDVQETLPVANVSLAATCSQTYAVCVRDGNTAADGAGGNPLASGATLEAATEADGGSASVDNSPVPAIVVAPTVHIVTVKRSSCGTALTSGGKVSLSIKTGPTTYTFTNFLTVTP